MTSYDLIAIGGGTGGLSAVRSARWAGRRAALLTDGPPGGDCTFTGCVPSKALIAAAAGGRSFPEAAQRIRDSVATIAAAESAEVLRAEGIDVHEGRAAFVDDRTVEIDGRRFTSDRIVIATGARAACPPIPGLNDVSFHTNQSIFDLEQAPESMVVLGGGAVGCELAQAFARLGVRVTLFEALDRLLAVEEPAASAVVVAALTADGVEVHLGRAVDRVEAGEGGVRVMAGEVTVVGSVLLVATGRQPVTEGLNLESVGIATDARGHIETDDHLRTSVAGVYAVGDVTGRLPFTHAADEMGRVAAGHALRVTPRWSFRTAAIPWCTFTDPEVARVGMTEAEAAAVGGTVAELPMAEFDRAITDDRTEGYVKIIAGPKTLTRRLAGGRVVGATIVGPRAGEMINEIALAVRTGMFVGRLGQTVHAYPTWGSAIPRVVAQFFYEIDGRRARPAEA